MRNRTVLWVLFSITLTILIIVTAGLIYFYPGRSVLRPLLATFDSDKVTIRIIPQIPAASTRKPTTGSVIIDGRRADLPEMAPDQEETTEITDKPIIEETKEAVAEPIVEAITEVLEEVTVELDPETPIGNVDLPLFVPDPAPERSIELDTPAIDEVISEPVVELELVVELEAVAEPIVEAITEVLEEVTVELDPEPVVEPEPAVDPEPEPEPEPEPAVEPEPEPEPELEPEELYYVIPTIEPRYWTVAGTYPTVNKAELGLNLLQKSGLSGTIAVISNQEFQLRLGPYGSVEQAIAMTNTVNNLAGFKDTAAVKITIPR